MTSKVLLRALAVCAAIAAQAAVGAPDDPSGGGQLFQVYEKEIHAKVSGVYELQDWVFFHSREPVTARGRFAKQKANQASLAGLTKAVFDWIDARLPNEADSQTESEKTMQRVGMTYATPKTSVRRSLSDLNVRVLYRDFEKGDNQVFVMDLAVLRDDLLRDAAKGSFEKRPKTVACQWRNVVRERLSSTDRMAFERDAGAYDLWTIDSCKTSGVQELCLTNSEERSCSQRCIKDLAACVAGLDSPAARQYAEMVSGMYDHLSNEVFSAQWITNAPRVRVMIMSFASCPVERQSVADDGWDALAAYCDQQEPAEKTCEAISSLLVRTPGAEEIWRVLGAALVRQNRRYAAASCFRNALRLKNDDVETLERMVLNYEAMGFVELAKGCALIAYGIAKEPCDCPESCRILKVK